MSKYLRAKDIAKMLNVTERTLARWIDKEQFPPPDLQVARVRLWENEALQKWIERNKPKQPAVA